ncbi:HAD family phosphatase [Phenylobacterium sp.]|jgi:HAD superfamily hydrolase (TIGR01509 family)|uniref:HAD family hydrolase n=1 Tax=Phenylobacterium sp. TaxID=1871053 RepID=UPI002F94616C
MSLPRPVKAVVFDMDGLLVDTEAVYCEALTLTAAEMGFELPTEVLHRMIGHAWAGSAVVLREHFGQDFDTDALREQSTRKFYEIAEAEVALKAGVTEILDELDRLGLPRAIATSSRRHDVEHHMSAHGLLDRFHAVLANGDYPKPKPDPSPYLTAAAALGVAPEDCLALEDSHNGVRAAAGAGMMTIMVPDLLHPTEEMHALCVRIARDLHEVRELLQAAG